MVSRLVSEDTLGPGTVEPEASLKTAGLASAPLYAGLGRGRPPGAAGAAARGGPGADVIAVGVFAAWFVVAGAAPERADDMSAGFSIIEAATIREILSS